MDYLSRLKQAQNTFSKSTGISRQPTSGVRPAPVSPSLLRISATTISQTQINVTWVPDRLVNPVYSLYRGTTSAFRSATLIYNGSDLSYSDTGLSFGTTYYYFITATSQGMTPSAPISTSASTTPSSTNYLLIPGYATDPGTDIFLINNTGDQILIN